MSSPRVMAILQARVSSTRLPGKVLLPILGKPMLARQVERLKRSLRLEKLVVATSDQVDDDAVVAMCDDLEISCYRGSLYDVLDRFYQCAREYEADHIVRLTGDCPLIDPAFVDILIEYYLGLDVAYASYCRPPSLPDGLDAEIFSFGALESAWTEARDKYDREHVVSFIVRRPDRFPLANWTYRHDLSNLRWTVDEPEDYEFVTRVFEELYPANPAFTMEDILMLLEQQPELAQINRKYQRKAGCEVISTPEPK